jgi:D-3-phosphoglycerate dehydrogenase
VSIHVPLTEHTRGLIDARAISRMRPGSILLNTSRGPIVSTPAVIEALKDGHLAAAGIDVFASEPPEPTLVVDVPNLIATPHVAYYSEEAVLESQTKATDQILAVFAGDEPSYRVA